MAIKKERTNKQMVTADHWGIISVTLHLMGNAVVAKYGLFTSKAAKNQGAHPLETEDVRINLEDLQRHLSPELRGLIEADMVEELTEDEDGKPKGRKGPLAGGSVIPD